MTSSQAINSEVGMHRKDELQLLFVYVKIQENKTICKTSGKLVVNLHLDQTSQEKCYFLESSAMDFSSRIQLHW